MLSRIKDIVIRNKMLIIITFEIFWIIIFLLSRVANEALDMPEFIYVNF